MTSKDIAQFQSDSFLLSLAELSPEEFEANRQFVARSTALPKPPSTALWFIPWTDNAIRGGVRTIFMVAAMMTRLWDTHHTFVIDDISRKGRLQILTRSLAENFGELRFSVQPFDRQSGSLQDLPESDIAVCTLWATAYLLARYGKCRRKLYFVQDFEPLFYPAGSVYGCIEATYRLGFDGIANSQGVHNRYRQYGNRATYFDPGVDTDVFTPTSERRSAGVDGWQIVFYGRPGNHRNAFALCAAILTRVKDLLGDRVRIVSAGSDWRPEDYGLEKVAENLGNLRSLDQIAKLYRESDLGLAFMFTAHPSYQPLEYMACGCVPVVNVNRSNEWLLRSGVNCLAVEPIPNLGARSVVELLFDPARMASLAEGGLETARSQRWDRAFARIAEFILH